MIVKNLLVVGVVAGFATAAAAQDSKGSWSIGGRVRADAQQSSTETKPDGGKSSTSKESSVSLNRAQFTLTGSKDAHSLAITYYADSNELYSAVVSHKFSPMITAHFGKMKVLAQSVENSYDGIDQYQWSWAAKHAPMNSTGARFDFAFEGDHNLSVQAVEGQNPDVTLNGKAVMFKSSGGLTTALQYRGNINGVKPIVSYTQVRTTATKGFIEGQEKPAYNFGNGYQTQLGLGAQFSAGPAKVEAEYDSITMLKQKDVAGDKDAVMTSLIGQVKYPVGASTPFLKVSSDASKMGADKGVGDQTGMNLALGVEHALDDSCRVHAVYMSQAKTTKNAQAKDDKETMTGFNFGITASM